MEVSPNVDWVRWGVRAAATTARRKHAGYVDVDDLEQECWMYLLERPELTEEDSESSRRLLAKSLQYHLDRYGMKQRMERDGTHPGDYFRYTARIVEELLPDAFTADTVMRSPSAHDAERSPKEPSRGFDREAMLADVQQGFQRLNDNDQQILSAKFFDGGVSNEVLGIQFSLSPQAAWNRVNRALTRLAKALNGDYQGRKFRRAISNATALVRTRRDWEAQ